MSVFLNRAMLYAYCRPKDRKRFNHKHKRESVKVAERLQLARFIVKKAELRQGTNPAFKSSTGSASKLLRSVEKYLWALEQRRLLLIRDGEITIRYQRPKGSFGRGDENYKEELLPLIALLEDTPELSKRSVGRRPRQSSKKYDFAASMAGVGREKGQGVKTAFKLKHPVLWHMAKETAAGRVLYEQDSVFVRAAQVQRLRDAEIDDFLKEFDYMAAALRGSCLEDEKLENDMRNFGASFPADDERPNLYFVTSDHHLRPQRHEHTEEFLRYFLILGTIGGKNILNGDFLDFWRDGTDYFDVTNQNPLLFRAMRKLRRTYYLIGNHDGRMVEQMQHVGFLDMAPGVSLAHDFYENGVYIEHGHQSDKNNVFSYERGILQENRLGRTVTRILGAVSGLWLPLWDWAQVILELFTNNPVLDPFKLGKKARKKSREAIVARVKEIYRQKNEEKLARGGDGFTENDPFIYIMGHVHHPLLFRRQSAIRGAIDRDPELSGKVQFHFTGAWCERNEYLGNFLIVDTEKKWVVPYIWDYGFPLPLVAER